MLAAASVGTLIGSLGAASLGGVARKGVLMAGAVMYGGLAVVGFSLQQSLGPALLFAVLPGIGHFSTDQVPDRINELLLEQIGANRT